ncbi:hypothetical protein QTP88_025422 [Uroleucon formosanum]
MLINPRVNKPCQYAAVDPGERCPSQKTPEDARIKTRFGSKNIYPLISITKIRADETADISGIEQLSICVRYLKDKLVHEKFLRFFPLFEFDAKCIAKTILETCSNVDIDMNKCVDQGYDGCVTLAGHISGVQKRINDVYPMAHFFHCATIVQSEENTVDFLKERGLIEIATPPCVYCGSQTKFYTRKERGKERTVIRCTKKGCQRTQSVREGINTIVQVDESLMRGKRKYIRGRLLGTDIATENVDVEELSDEEEPDFNNRNYDKKLSGPWVFGMCQKDENGVIDTRYFIIEKRDRQIHSDEWLAYKTKSNY